MFIFSRPFILIATRSLLFPRNDVKRAIVREQLRNNHLTSFSGERRFLFLLRISCAFTNCAFTDSGPVPAFDVALAERYSNVSFDLMSLRRERPFPHRRP